LKPAKESKKLKRQRYVLPQEEARPHKEQVLLSAVADLAFITKYGNIIVKSAAA
jgi:hypothetical protein